MSVGRYKGHNSLAEMVSTHTDKWRDGLILLREKSENADDKAYYDHELSALEDIEHSVSADLIDDIAIQ